MSTAPVTQQMKLIRGLALGVTASAVVMLADYVRREIQRRGYPSWQECQCEYKHQKIIFQVWHSRHEQQGETIVSQEWGTYLIDPPHTMRRFLHHGSQILAILNPRGRYVERVTLSPQQAQHFASLLRSLYADGSDQEEDTGKDLVSTQVDRVVWRREVLHFPRYIFDVCLRRLYPVHLSQERAAQAQALPALWDPHRNLPLTSEGSLLHLGIGTRIDCIGWNASQISYCTARLGQG
ncbi:MAG TPA: hypothetical protein VL485_23610 [Ktedonobacteraceae bacterium]|jgi:hypothetical protein|nr:hypothetical protein [Ktedonobacteraceae bacterium]